MRREQRDERDKDEKQRIISLLGISIVICLSTANLLHRDDVIGKKISLLSFAATSIPA